MYCSQCGKQIPVNRTICYACEDKLRAQQMSTPLPETIPAATMPATAPAEAAFMPEKKKRIWLWVCIGFVILALAAAAVWFFVLRSDKEESKKAQVAQQAEAALTVGDYAVSALEFNYFYREIATNCDMYASYLGIDNTVPLTEQQVDSSDLSLVGLIGLDTTCLNSLTSVDGAYDFTWAELIAYNAMRNAASAYAIYQEAQKAGFALDDDALESIDNSIAEFKGYAEGYHMSLDEYIESVFGRGCDEAGYRHYLTVVNTASAYPSAVLETYTQEQIAARDAQSPEQFHTVAYYYYSIDASEAEEDYFEEYSGEEVAEVDSFDAMAYNEAKAMKESFDVNRYRAEINADYDREFLDQLAEAGQLNEEAVKWLCEEANEGDVKMFTIEADSEQEDSENTYIVMKFITRKDYYTANYLSITIENAYNDEGKNDAQPEIDAIKAALEADPSEENFRDLIPPMAEGDRAVDGVHENETRFAAAQSSDELFAWLMLEERTKGDWTMIDTYDKTEFCFYIGEGQSYREMCVKSTMLNEWYAEITENAIASCSYSFEALDREALGYYN